MDVVYFVRGQKHRELLELSIASVRRYGYDEARVCVYTDDPEVESIGDVFVRAAPGRPMMVANLDAQFNHISRCEPGSYVLFLDCDVLLRKAFPFITSRVVHLYPTWRDHEGVNEKGEKVVGVAARMPYNYGVLGAYATPETIEAFCWLRARIMQMSDEHQAWYGNQFALFDLCGHPAASPERAIRWSLTDMGGTALMVERLPCETWNYSPEKAGEDVADKGILHFKGGRKDLMEKYL